MYQVNAGVLVEKQIQPDTPIKFWQPSCAVPNTAPCDPKKTNYKDNPYLVAGHQRESTYTEHEFTLELPYDVMGVPLEPKFCGNTINVNTVSFRQYIEFLERKYRRSFYRLVGNNQRNVEIDTWALPQYNDVDLSQFSANLNDQASTLQRNRSQLDETQEIKCEPESDRISIDELAQLSPQNGKVSYIDVVYLVYSTKLIKLICSLLHYRQGAKVMKVFNFVNETKCSLLPQYPLLGAKMYRHFSENISCSEKQILPKHKYLCIF